MIMLFHGYYATSSTIRLLRTYRKNHTLIKPIDADFIYLSNGFCFVRFESKLVEILIFLYFSKLSYFFKLKTPELAGL